MRFLRRSDVRIGRCTRKVRPMKRADASPVVTAPQGFPTSEVILDPEAQWCEVVATAAVARPVSCPQASPVRLTLAARLGDKIDGAWWPRTGVIARELPELVAVLDVPLGTVTDISVNWSSLQSQPNLNWHWFQGVHPHVMTVDGRNARTKLLIVPHRTAAALAVMLLRQAASMPIYPVHRDSRAFETAECIVRAARGDKLFEVSRSRSVASAAALGE